LIQKSGAKEIILVGDYTRPPTKKQQRETKPTERFDTGPPMCPKRIESYDDISTPGGSSSRKERCECRTPPSKTSLNNKPWKKVLDVAPRFPLKSRGRCDDVPALSSCVGGNQSRTKESLLGIFDEVTNICGKAGIGAPYDDMFLSPKSARWSARPALVRQKTMPALFLCRS
jgi:hypothetical protein